MEKWSKEDTDPPRRHHYVPQFYLRRWADEKNRLVMLNRVDGRLVTASVKKALAQVDLYTIQTEEGDVSYAVERMLSWIEGKASQAIADLLAGSALSSDQREYLASFMALQAVRGRDWRAQHDYFLDHMNETFLEMSFATPEMTRRRLEEQHHRSVSDDEVSSMLEFVRDKSRYEIKTHPNMAIKLMLESSMELTAVFLTKYWNVVECPDGNLLTSDHPVTAIRRKNRFGRGGLGDAHAVLFPLSPSALLVLSTTRNSPVADELSDTDLRKIVDHHAFFAWEWVLGPPQHPWYEAIGSSLVRRPRQEPTISEYEMEDGSTMVQFHYEVPSADQVETPEGIIHRSKAGGQELRGTFSSKVFRAPDPGTARHRS